MTVSGLHSAVLAPFFYSYYSIAIVRSILLLILRLVLQPFHIFLDLVYIFGAPVHPYIYSWLYPILYFTFCEGSIGVESLIQFLREDIRLAIIGITWFFHQICSSALPPNIHICFADLSLQRFLSGLVPDHIIYRDLDSAPRFYHKAIFYLLLCTGLYPFQLQPKTKSVQ